MVSKSASTKIVNFMAPESRVLVLGRGSIDYIVKIHYFFENLLFCSWVLNKLTKNIVMMWKNTFVNFMTPWDRGSDLRVELYWLYSENTLIL